MVMYIPFLWISFPRDLVKRIGRRLSLRRKKLIARELLSPGTIKEVLSHAHVRSLEQRARNAHDQSEKTLTDRLF